MNSMISPIRLVGVVGGAVALVVLIWFGGPFVAIAGRAPLDPLWTRILASALVVLSIVGYQAWRFLKRRRAAKALGDAIVDEPTAPGDAEVLRKRLEAAVRTVGRSGGGTKLHDLPWYVIIGPPGAGKTTALTKSGLKFADADEDGSASHSGVGGTRYCDWWFADDAVLIDTAGRYTTQDSDVANDSNSWMAFLGLLRQHRPSQPVNGILVAISIEDVMTSTRGQLAGHAAAIRKRIAEIGDALHIDFPVYVLLTKCDLVAGFGEFFGGLKEAERRKVWGTTFDRNGTGGPVAARVQTEIDALVERLTAETADRLQDEPDPVARIAVFGFPAQVATLGAKLGAFMDDVFRPSRTGSSGSLRGFYLCSGTQEGTPFDQILGAYGRATGTTQKLRAGTGRSYFIHDLLAKVVFGEAGWVRRRPAAVRRDRIVRGAVLGSFVVATAALAGLWWTSYGTNRDLIRSVRNSIGQYRGIRTAEAGETISEPDFHDVLSQLHVLRTMPAGYADEQAAKALEEGLGLSVRERIRSAATTSYRQGLERMLRSRIVLRLERQIEENVGDPIFVYEALKVYLMVGGKAPEVDRNLVFSWLERDWETFYPGPSNLDGRTELASHLEAMLDLETGTRPVVELNQVLVSDAQKSLARMRMADRAYALLKSGQHLIGRSDWKASDAGGPDAAAVFAVSDGAPLEQVTVPALYTWDGFHGYLMPQLSLVAQKLLDEQWVMGEVGKQEAVEQQFASLGPQILDLYRQDFLTTWTAALGRLGFASMSADKPQYLALSALAAPTSPLRYLVESVVSETSLTQERAAPDEKSAEGGGEVGKDAPEGRERLDGLARIGIDLALSKSQRRAGTQSEPPTQPGAAIEAAFAQWRNLVRGETGRRPVDVLVQNFADILQSLGAAGIASQSGTATENLQIQVASLKTALTRVPPPIRAMLASAVADFEGDAAGTSTARLEEALAGTVTRYCQQVVSDRYPFSPKSTRDVPMRDFARLFGPQGVLDSFFAQNLAPLVDTSGETWKWRDDQPLSQELHAGALRDFQRAADIREAFFSESGETPSVQLTVGANTMSADVEFAILRVGERIIQTAQFGNERTPPVEWPGQGTGGVRLDLWPELPGRESAVEMQGPWALMRLLDWGSVSKNEDGVVARFLVGGREVSYELSSGSVFNPFRLDALRQFRCPTGL